MRLVAAAVILALWTACAPRPVVAPKQPDQPPPVPAVEVVNPNFELVVSEVVPNADDEGVSYTKIFVDGKEAGQTPVGPRSQERRFQLSLPTGNQPVRLEHWHLPSVGEWTRLPDARQPRERFVRVEDGSIARLTLRYGADGMPFLQQPRDSAAH
jgi:hypothetical protein